jgi:hypothetical protein
MAGEVGSVSRRKSGREHPVAQRKWPEKSFRRAFQSLISSQIRTVKRQWTKRSMLFSSICLHSGQSPQLYQPRLRNQSVIQSLFWGTSHAWFFILWGAQAIETSLYMLVSIRPKIATYMRKPRNIVHYRLASKLYHLPHAHRGAHFK